MRPPRRRLLIGAALVGSAVLADCGSGDGGTTPETGSLRVTVTTVGMDLDPNGYTLVLNGTPRGELSLQADTVLTGLPAGSITVNLLGVASNCSPTTALPLALTVVPNQTGTAAISVACVATTGAIHLTTSTSGVDLDLNGYTYRVDNGPTLHIGSAAEITVTGLAEGPHSVTLGDIAANCAPVGGNTQPASVVAGDTVAVAYGVTCAPTTGAIRAVAVTTGAAPDPDGYALSLDGGSPRAVGASGQLDFLGLAPGDHTVLLSGAAPNCALSGPNPQTAAVVAGDTTLVEFALTCPEVGTVAVATVTQGLSQDPDGYAITLDGGPSVQLRGTDTTMLTNLIVGSHSAQIIGIVPNCTLAEPNPRSITVAANTVTLVTATVSCTLVPGPRANSVVFTRYTPDSSTGENNHDLYAVAPDGSGLTPIVTGPGFAWQGSWSPDGAQILYEYRASPGDAPGAQIRVRNADGTNDRLVSAGQLPNWSPDGAQIAYVKNGVYVMQADGTGSHKVSPGSPEFMDLALFPAWSPDGSRIAFVGGGGDIVVCRADGTGAHAVTPLGVTAGRPAWSPDGTRIAFRVDGSPGIAVVNTDGTGYGTLVNPGGTLDDPTWSPDGTQLIFTTSSGGTLLLFRINVNGTGLTAVTGGAGHDILPTWGR